MKQNIPLLIVIWLLASTAQTVHFYIYFEQTLSNSIWWSFKDWFVWLVLLSVLITTLPQRLLTWERKNLSKLIFLGIVCGWLQIIIANRIGWLVSSPDTFTRPFLDDIWHLYKKRWLQNIFYFVVLWTVLVKLLVHKQAENKVLKAPNNSKTANKTQRFQIVDGKNSHWLEYQQIQTIESAGNYVAVNTANDQSLIRNTLKNLELSFINNGFIKVSRSCLVNKAYITAFKRINRSRMEITIKGGISVVVGRTYWSEVKQQLSQPL